MTIIILVFFVILLVPARITRKNDKYLDKNYTNIIKGFFLLFVFMSHLTQYKLPFSNEWYDTIGLKFNAKLGQLMVTMFLFYSGYGIMESIKRKGNEYINNLPKKRILATWLHFASAVLIFAVIYFYEHKFSAKKLILSLAGWDSVGNSNWYIFCIIILYFITYLSAKAFKNDNKKMLISIFIGTLLYTLIMSLYKETYWYNTAFCFVFGTIYSVYKEKIEQFLEGKELILIVYSIVGFIIAYNLKKNICWYYIYSILFVSIILLMTRKLNMKNIVLEWIGKNLFPLYIFQRLPMMLLNKVQYMHNNPYILFVTSFILTIAIAICYNMILKINSKIKTSINKVYN